MRTFLSVVILACLALTGCKPPPPKEVEISGQVFVTLQNRNTLKLSLTPVLLVEETDGSKHVESVREEHKSTIRSALAKVENLTTNLAVLEAQWQPHIDSRAKLRAEGDRLVKISEANADNAGRMTPVQFQQVMKVNAEIKTKLEALLVESRKIQAESSNGVKAIADTKAALEIAEKAMDALPTVQNLLFSKPWPGIVAQTMTDADGKFRFRVPGGRKFLVVAETKRALPSTKEDGKEEVYRWVVNAIPSSGSDVNLHNENLFDSP